MKKILLLLSVMLSAMSFAQGHETFDNLELTGNSYATGTFVGQDGISWSYGEARGDLELNGTALTLGRNRANPMFLESATISGGMGTLEFSYIQAFSAGVGVEVLVNDELVYTATSDDEMGVIKSSGVITLDVEGDVVLKFNNPEGFGQITLDDIVWTEFDTTTGIDDKKSVNFSYFPNPTKNFLNITSNTSIVNVEGFNILGQKVITNNKFNAGKVDLSFLPSGYYVFRVKFENGVQESFKVLKQ